MQTLLSTITFHEIYQRQPLCVGFFIFNFLRHLLQAATAVRRFPSMHILHTKTVAGLLRAAFNVVTQRKRVVDAVWGHRTPCQCYIYMTHYTPR